MKPLEERYRELVEKLYSPSRVKAKEERKRLRREFEETVDNMQTLDSQLPPEYETHGWVWLFLRK